MRFIASISGTPRKALDITVPIRISPELTNRTLPSVSALTMSTMVPTCAKPPTPSPSGSKCPWYSESESTVSSCVHPKLQKTVRPKTKVRTIRCNVFMKKAPRLNIVPISLYLKTVTTSYRFACLLTSTNAMSIRLRFFGGEKCNLRN